MRLYLHIPFCVSKCLYCDFVSGPASRETRFAYLEALLREMTMAAESGTVDGNGLKSVYCGGGTPSIFEPSDLKRLLDRAGELWGWSTAAEVTVEINPSTWTLSRLAEAVGAGFNRLSIGAQSFDDDVLAVLGRSHGAEQSRRLVEQAVRTGGAKVSIDLIFGVPGQTPASWRNTLEEALELRPGHISAYALTLEPLTPLGQSVEAGVTVMPRDDETAEMYEEACRLLEAAGFNHYEISNFALPGQECRHNQAYWRRRDYLGLGVAAHSFTGPDIRKLNTPDVADYIARVETGVSPLQETERLSPEEVREEEIFLSLRTANGLEMEVLAESGGRPEAVRKEWDALVAEGLAWRRGSRRGLTAKGMFVSNHIISGLFAG